jgi:hypothetical protein
MEVRRTMIGIVYLDNDSVKPAHRRHGRRLPFGSTLVNFRARALTLPCLLSA